MYVSLPTSRRPAHPLVASQKYLRVIKFELCRLYEIQSSLRALSYFDIRGRLRLTLQLGIVALSIPMAIDQAIGTDPAEPIAAEEDGKEVVRRSLLGPRLACVPLTSLPSVLISAHSGALALAVTLLERGERIV